MEWLWDTVVDERNEIMHLDKELQKLEDRIKEQTLGSQETQEALRSMVQGRIDQHQKPGAGIESPNRALNPNAGMRSRRDALSGNNKLWLTNLQNDPGLWDEAPAAVRNVASDKLREDAMALRFNRLRRNTGIQSEFDVELNAVLSGQSWGGARHVTGMRSGGRQMGQEIIGKVKPEHRKKPQGERTLYFVGGTTGAGKTTIIKDKKVRLPGDTEAAHIDPDYVKTGLRGWDPQDPGRVHHESRRVTDRIMDDAMNGGMDVVVQGTGKRTEHLRDAKARGYKTSGQFVWVPGKEADRRIAQRKTEGGPNIPNSFGSLIAGELRNGIVSRQITDGLYDEFHLWDNTGREPRLIAYRTQDGQFAIYGRKEFDDFFGASGKHVERYWQKNK
jgi:predicted ABC-type ATPase